jgi:D-3-phosphoglycerate dehydrogenase
MNTPQANSVATAEQTMALMLATSRHTPNAHRALAEGRWERVKFAGTELNDKTLGIIGFGRIGRLVAVRAQAFGMEVVAADPYVSEEVGRDAGVTLVDLNELLAESDYITLHTPSTTETENLLTAEAIASMKDGVVIINAARGSLIDEEALAAKIQAFADQFTPSVVEGDEPEAEVQADARTRMVDSDVTLPEEDITRDEDPG